MSNFLSPAVITAAFQEIIQEALQDVQPGVIVRMGLPRGLDLSQGPEVSIYLYQVSPNASLQNHGLRTRPADGARIDLPSTALDLHYLISFFGEHDLVSERMLGKVAARLNAIPVLPQERIRSIIQADGPFGYLSASDLADQPDLVKLTPAFLPLEELSKLWTVFFQIAHRVSLQYIAGPVLVDADPPPPRALP